MSSFAKYFTFWHTNSVNVKWCSANSAVLSDVLYFILPLVIFRSAHLCSFRLPFVLVQYHIYRMYKCACVHKWQIFQLNGRNSDFRMKIIYEFSEINSNHSINSFMVHIMLCDFISLECWTRKAAVTEFGWLAASPTKRHIYTVSWCVLDELFVNLRSMF